MTDCHSRPPCALNWLREDKCRASRLKWQIDSACREAKVNRVTKRKRRQFLLCDKWGISAQAPKLKPLNFTLLSDHLFQSKKLSKHSKASAVNKKNAMIRKKSTSVEMKHLFSLAEWDHICGEYFWCTWNYKETTGWAAHISIMKTEIQKTDTTAKDLEYFISSC